MKRWTIASRPQPRRGMMTVFMTCLWLSISSMALAEEPYLKFVQGLRERQYFDTALQYLDTLEQRGEVPAPIKELIPYERALTLLQSSNLVQSPEAQSDQLDQAQAYLESFLKQSPNHELSARAKTELANIMLGKAQVLIWQSRSPSNAENRSKFQQDARKLIQQARTIFQAANDAYKAEWESYGVYIPEDEKEKRALRQVAEGLYMKAQLDLASCTYEEAQTYDRGSEKFLELLKEASLQFEELHTKYRSQYAGLFARTMQGKCFEEQNDIRKALGIYDELLGHPGKSQGLKRLQSQVRHFRLICLNHESRKDYELVIIEADEWLKANRGYTRTTTGLGIRWEMAQAQESLAMDRNTPEADRTRLLRQALENAREINKYAGPFKDVSNSMIQRVLVAMDREPGDPKDFDSAFGTANNMLEQIGELREELKTAESSGNKEKIANAEGELQAVLSETERMYRLALALADAGTENSQINAARYRLAYMFYLQRKSFETAVIGDYVSLRAMKEDPTMALDGAYLGLAGLMQAVNDASEERKQEVLDMMVQMCERIAVNWPNSDRATDARMEMGRIYRLNKQPLEAAKWYAQVPETTPQYATAQLEAGQAYWNAYLSAIVNEDDVSADELKDWQNQAAQHLSNGITARQKGLPADKASPAELIRGKVSLSQIEIMRGNDQRAVELMTQDPHSVVKAISIADGEPRPQKETEIKSSTFASFAYQQLLRAYIGTRQLEQAEQTRAALEKVAGQGDGGEALTAVYIELGRELQNELERLRKQGDQERLAAVRSGFEAFLKQLFERKSGQNYSSLLWIAETYFGMAEGSAEEPQKANEYYSAASNTYGEILKRGSNDPNFVDSTRLTGVRLRLVNCKKAEGDYAAAEENVKAVLKENPKVLDAQIAAAEVYQAWGKADADTEKFLLSIRGKQFDDGTAIWGWGNIGKRLLLIIDGGNAPPEYIERNREVQFHLAQSRLQLAQNSTDIDQADEHLKRAKLEILTYARFSPDLFETPWWNKFDQLYQDIQTNLGEVVIALQKPETQIAANEDPSSSNYAQPVEEIAQAEEQTESTAQPKEESSKLGTYITMGIVVLLGIGIIGYTLTSAGKRPQKRSTAEMVATMPKAEKKRKSSAGTSTPQKPRKTSSTSSGDAAAEQTGTQKPKKRPVSTSAQTQKKRVRKKPPTEES